MAKTPAMNVVNNGDLVDRIFTLSSPASIFQFGRTSHTAHAFMQNYSRRAWNVDRHLGRFFSNPRAFRELQARTGTLVSGSNALQFFDRSFYPESDLDVYLHCGREREVGAFLIADGYQFQPSPSQSPDFMDYDAHVYTQRDDRPFDYPKRITPYDVLSDPAGDAVYEMPFAWGVVIIESFTKPSTKDGGNHLKVQLLVTRSCPIEAVLLFHSTCVMNVIAYNAAYSLYPRATFEARTSLHTPRNGKDIDSPGVQKYVRRGWRMIDTVSSADERAYAVGSRWIDDKHSWVIKFPDSPDPHTPTPLSPALRDDPVVATNWALLDSVQPWISYRILQSSSLHYVYVMSDAELHAHLREKLWRNLFAEYTKERGAGYSELTAQSKFNIRVCMDDDLIKHCTTYRTRLRTEGHTPIEYQSRKAYVDAPPHFWLTWDRIARYSRPARTDWNDSHFAVKFGDFPNMAPERRGELLSAYYA